MNNPQPNQAPKSKTGMLIRKPVADVLAGLKALLEHHVRLNLVADRFPNGIEAH